MKKVTKFSYNPRPSINHVIIEGAWVDSRTDDQLLIEVRSLRDKLLSSSDWTQLSDVQMSDELKEKWLTWRATLRDIPQSGMSISDMRQMLELLDRDRPK